MPTLDPAAVGRLAILMVLELEEPYVDLESAHLIAIRSAAAMIKFVLILLEEVFADVDEMSADGGGASALDALDLFQKNGQER